MSVPCRDAQVDAYSLLFLPKPSDARALSRAELMPSRAPLAASFTFAPIPPSASAGFCSPRRSSAFWLIAFDASDAFCCAVSAIPWALSETPCEASLAADCRPWTASFAWRSSEFACAPLEALLLLDWLKVGMGVEVGCLVGWLVTARGKPCFFAIRCVLLCVCVCVCAIVFFLLYLRRRLLVCGCAHRDVKRTHRPKPAITARRKGRGRGVEREGVGEGQRQTSKAPKERATVLWVCVVFCISCVRGQRVRDARGALLLLGRACGVVLTDAVRTFVTRQRMR